MLPHSLSRFLTLAVFLSLWLAVAPAWAGSMLLLGAGGSGAAAAGYTGPGDVVASAKAWWGMRCYSAAYSGNVADITDTSTGNTTGTRLQCSGGTVSALVSGSACTFVTGNACSSLATTCAVSCSVLTLYDQSGANTCAAAPCNVTNATLASRPTVTISCTGSNPCMVFNGSQNLVISGQALPLVSQPYTVSAVAERTGNTTAFGDWFGSNGASVQSMFNNAAGNVAQYANTAVKVAGGTQAENAFHAIQEIYNDASASNIYADGSSTVTTGAGVNNVGSDLTIGAGNNPLTGKIAEVGLWASAFSAGNQSSMNSNQHTYWGF